MTQHSTGTGEHATDPMSLLELDRTVGVVRASRIADPTGLARTLAGAGIRWVEFTFTTPGVLDAIAEAVQEPGVAVGAGTVLTAAQAKDAIAAGAQFLLTPDLRPEVAAVAREAGTLLVMGALTPTEISQAVDLGSAAVKIFPSGPLGPGYLKAIRGPFPGARLIPTGGVNAGNARAFLEAGAFAVGAGTDVVLPELVERGEHDGIAERAAAFVKSLRP